MEQLNLFTDKTCSHCGKELAPHEKNPQLANGFYDQDTAELVHWNCKQLHYEKKRLNGMAGLYSEMPFLL